MSKTKRIVILAGVVGLSFFGLLLLSFAIHLMLLSNDHFNWLEGPSSH